MYTETIIPKEENVNIHIPKSYLNRELEITIKIKEPKSFDKFFGTLKVENLEEEISKIRNGWEREI